MKIDLNADCLTSWQANLFFGQTCFPINICNSSSYKHSGPKILVKKYNGLFFKELLIKLYLHWKNL